MDTCTGGNSSARTGCRPGSSGTVLTISGSGFYQHDPEANAVSFSGGSGSAPVCYSLWTSLGSGTVLCTMYVWDGDTSGTWEVSVTALGVATEGQRATMEVLPPQPVVSSVSCVSPCRSGTTITLSGYFFPTTLSNSALNFSAPDIDEDAPLCTTTAATNTSLTCTLSVAPGATGDYSAALYNLLDPDTPSSATALTLYNPHPQVITITADPGWCGYQTLNTLGRCSAGNGYITMTGRHFHRWRYWLHTISFASNTESPPYLQGAPETADADAPPPKCTPTYSSETTLECYLEVYYSGPYIMTVTLGQSDDTHVNRLYLEHLPPETLNISGHGCSTNETVDGGRVRCLAGTQLTVMGRRFIPSAAGVSYNVVSFTGGAWGAPSCTAVASTLHFISCTLAVPVGTAGTWSVTVSTGGKASATPADQGIILDVEQPRLATLIDPAGVCSIGADGVADCVAGTVSLPGDSITLIGSGFSTTAAQNRVQLSGGEIGGIGAQAPYCSPLSATATAITCGFVAPFEATGTWTVRVVVGETVSSPLYSPRVRLTPVLANNVSITLPLNPDDVVVAGADFTLRLTTHGDAFAVEAPTGALGNFSLQWWDSGACPNGAELFGHAAAALSPWAVSGGAYEIPGYRIPLPGAYVISAQVVSAAGQRLASVRRGVAAIASAGALPVVEKAAGCAQWAAEDWVSIVDSQRVLRRKWTGADCAHGGRITLHGVHFDAFSAVTFDPPVASCAAPLHTTSVPPLLLVCEVLVAAPLLALTTVTVRTRRGAIDPVVALWVYRDRDSVALVDTAHPAVVSSGGSLSLQGSGFAPNATKNAVLFLPHYAGGVNGSTPLGPLPSGPAPSCTAQWVNAAGSALRCSVSCAALTFGLWRVAVSTPSAPNASEGGPLVRCHAPPEGPPAVEGLRGCAPSADGLEVHCTALRPRVTIMGSRFDSLPWRNFVELEGLPSAGGPAPSSCTGGVAADYSDTAQLVCELRASPFTYGLYRIRVRTPAGTAAAPLPLRFTADPREGEVSPPIATYISGCLGAAHLQVGLRTAHVQRYCNDGANLSFLATSLDWRLPPEGPTAVAFTALPEATAAAAAAGLIAANWTGNSSCCTAPPHCRITSLRPWAAEGASYPSGSRYQRVECALEVPQGADGVWQMALHNGREATEPLAALIPRRVPRPYLTAIAPAEGSTCTESPGAAALGPVQCPGYGPRAAVTLSGYALPEAPERSGVAFSGGTGTPPSCTVVAAGENALTCVVRCDATTAGYWAMTITNTDWGRFESRPPLGELRCHVEATAPLVVTAVQGCASKLGCVTGEVLTFTGTAFDTAAQDHTVAFAPAATAGGDTPSCAVTGGNSTRLLCRLSVALGSGGRWAVLIKRPADAGPAGVGLTVGVYAPPAGPPVLRALSDRVLILGGTVTVIGSGFDADPGKNVVSLAPADGPNATQGTPPVLVVARAARDTLVCNVTAADQTTSGRWMLTVATALGATASLVVTIVLPAASLTGAVGCLAELYCALGDTLRLWGKGLREERDAPAWVPGAGATGTVQCAATAYGPSGEWIDCTVSVGAAAAGVWRVTLAGSDLPGYERLPYIIPELPPLVTDVAGCSAYGSRVHRCENGTRLRLRGARFDLVPWRNEVLFPPRDEGALASTPECAPAPRPGAGAAELAAGSELLECDLLFPAAAAGAAQWGAVLRTAGGEQEFATIVFAAELVSVTPTVAALQPALGATATATLAFGYSQEPSAAPSLLSPSGEIVTVTMLGSLADFAEQAFRELAAGAVGVEAALVVILSIAEASVLVTFFYNSPLAGDLAAAFVAAVRSGNVSGALSAEVAGAARPTAAPSPAAPSDPPGPPPQPSRGDGGEPPVWLAPAGGGAGGVLVLAAAAYCFYRRKQREPRRPRPPATLGAGGAAARRGSVESNASSAALEPGGSATLDHGNVFDMLHTSSSMQGGDDRAASEAASAVLLRPTNLWPSRAEGVGSDPPQETAPQRRSARRARLSVAFPVLAADGAGAAVGGRAEDASSPAVNLEPVLGRPVDGPLAAGAAPAGAPAAPMRQQVLVLGGAGAIKRAGLVIDSSSDALSGQAEPGSSRGTAFHEDPLRSAETNPLRPRPPSRPSGRRPPSGIVLGGMLAEKRAPDDLLGHPAARSIWRAAADPQSERAAVAGLLLVDDDSEGGPDEEADGSSGSAREPDAAPSQGRDADAP